MTSANCLRRRKAARSGGIIRKFRPDYLVRLANRKMLVLEVKGQDNQEQQTKREFLSEGVRAVNSHGGFGVWASDVSRNPTDIHEIPSAVRQSLNLHWLRSRRARDRASLGI
jgi:hypothetical protein